MRPVILDVDPGVDDALAILLALHSPELELVGISAVNGNVPLSQTTENALKVLELGGRTDIPVYMGAERPLQREPIHAFEVHGPHGLGGAHLPEPETLPAGDAVDFLIRGIQSRTGEVIVVATGPLTNLALAESRAPGILKQARRVVVMGGALHPPGNISPLSEFNFCADPHAARQVLACGANLALVPLEASRQVWLERELLQQRIADREEPIAMFCAAAAQTAMAYEEQLYGRAGIYLHDPLAVGLAIYPELCRMQSLWLDVETSGELTAGQVVVDRRPFVRQGQRAGREVECGVEVQGEGFIDLVLERVLK